MTTQEILQNACAVKMHLAALDTKTKNEALLAMSSALLANTTSILEANAADIEAARGTVSDVMLDRLALNEDRIKGMADGIAKVAALPDPIGRTLSEDVTDDGLVLRKISVPMGVIAIIYESRPNVTSDAAALCLKSGNVCILRGGKEAYRTSKAIVMAMRDALYEMGLEPDFINIIDDTSRESATELMKARGYVDLLIPRGGAGLIRACVEQACVPCIETGTGICSVYVDDTADLEMALNIIENAKTQRPSVCNAEEQLLINEAVADEFLPMLYERLVTEREAADLTPVELHVDAKTFATLEVEMGINNPPYVLLADDEDFDTEFLDYVLAVKIVEDVEEAVLHISLHSTHHSEAIITNTVENATYFTTYIDSAAIYVNASTRFTDGGMFGLGCEMGISTQKLHARGPMGLKELTSYKYIVAGEGQVRR